MQRTAALTGMKSISSPLYGAKRARSVAKVVALPKCAGLIFSGFGGYFTILYRAGDCGVIPSVGHSKPRVGVFVLVLATKAQ
jgi:hypothetical protein